MLKHPVSDQCGFMGSWQLTHPCPYAVRSWVLKHPLNKVRCGWMGAHAPMHPVHELGAHTPNRRVRLPYWVLKHPNK